MPPGSTGHRQTDWGTAGNPKSVTRTIRISMTDNMRFTPDQVDVNHGDTVNHAGADRIHVEPGKTGELVWHFNRIGSCDFARLLPGHYQVGMVGRINGAAVG